MRALTTYERARVELLLANWAQSKVGGWARDYATSSIYEDTVSGRGVEYQTRYPVIQVDADRVNAVVYGRAASQFLPAFVPMKVEYQEPLVMSYLGESTQMEIARALEISQQTVADRLARARWLIWEALCQPCDSAGTRAG